MSGGPAPAGSKWRLYVGIAALVLAAIFILQNSQEVAVKFFFAETQMPLIFALLLVGLLGFVTGLALPRFRRPRD